MKIDKHSLDIPKQSERTLEHDMDIHAATIIAGFAHEDNLLHSTEGYLAVLRGIQYGRQLERVKRIP